MPKLTDTQLVLLAAAAQRDDGALLPPPKRLEINAGTLTGVLKSLLRKGLTEERPAPPDAPAWRETGDGQRLQLILSSAGLEALGIETAAEKKRTHTPTHGKSANTRKSAATSKPPGNKQDLILGLLQRPAGATVPDLQKATGWQPHSVRAALTGLRKKGYETLRTNPDGGATRYRVIGNRKAG